MILRAVIIIIAENFQDPTWKRRQDLKHLARDLKAIYSGDFKYLWASDGRCELYNIAADPFESDNLVDKLPQKVQELNAQLERWNSSFNLFFFIILHDRGDTGNHYGAD